MDHTVEEHGEKLNELCRLCGERALTQAERRKGKRNKLMCSSYLTDILLIFNIFIARDVKNVHPRHMCFKCYKQMCNLKKRGGEQSLSNAQMRVSKVDKMWVECDTSISENECSVCVKYLQTCLGRSGFNTVKKREENKSISTFAAERHAVVTDIHGISDTMTMDTHTYFTNTSPIDIEIASPSAVVFEELDEAIALNHDQEWNISPEVNTSTYQSLESETSSHKDGTYTEIMEHTLQTHNEKLKNLCRLCGKRCLNKKQRETGKKLRKVSAFQKDVLIICHTNINDDINDFHSPSICHICANIIRRIKREGSETTLRKFLESFKKTDNIWTVFDCSISENDCLSCATYDSFAKGNRFEKKLEQIEKSQGLLEGGSIYGAEPTVYAEEVEINPEEESIFSEPVSSSYAPSFLTERTIDVDESMDVAESENTDMIMHLARALESGDPNTYEDDSIEPGQTNLSRLSVDFHRITENPRRSVLYGCSMQKTSETLNNQAYNFATDPHIESIKLENTANSAADMDEEEKLLEEKLLTDNEGPVICLWCDHIFSQSVDRDHHMKLCHEEEYREMKRRNQTLGCAGGEDVCELTSQPHVSSSNLDINDKQNLSLIKHDAAEFLERSRVIKEELEDVDMSQDQFEDQSAPPIQCDDMLTSLVKLEDEETSLVQYEDQDTSSLVQYEDQDTSVIKLEEEDEETSLVQYEDQDTSVIKLEEEDVLQEEVEDHVTSVIKLEDLSVKLEEEDTLQVQFEEKDIPVINLEGDDRFQTQFEERDTPVVNLEGDDVSVKNSEDYDTLHLHEQFVDMDPPVIKLEDDDKLQVQFEDKDMPAVNLSGVDPSEVHFEDQDTSGINSEDEDTLQDQVEDQDTLIINLEEDMLQIQCEYQNTSRKTSEGEDTSQVQFEDKDMSIVNSEYKDKLQLQFDVQDTSSIQFEDKPTSIVKLEGLATSEVRLDDPATRKAKSISTFEDESGDSLSWKNSPQSSSLDCYKTNTFPFENCLDSEDGDSSGPQDCDNDLDSDPTKYANGKWDNSVVDNNYHDCRNQVGDDTITGDTPPPEELPYKCEICEKMYKHKASLRRHKMYHTGILPFSCEICSKSFIRYYDLRIHTKTHSDERPFHCELCDKTFKSKVILRKHARTHSTERPFKCEVCGECFKRKDVLNNHTESHFLEVRLFKCEVCGKSFKTKSVLHSHTAVHRKDRTYECDVCNKNFKCRKGLTEHRRIHFIEVRPFKCDLCSKTFKRRAHLDDHSAVHLKERFFACDICHKTYKRQRDVENHKKIHAGFQITLE